MNNNNLDDKQSFECLYNANKHKVQAIIHRFVRDSFDVEDIMQITFFRAWLYRDDFHGNSAYSTWLISIAINTALNYISSAYCKRLKKTRSLEDIQEVYKYDNEINGSPETILCNEEDYMIVVTLVEKLPMFIKECIIMALIYGYSYEEIAHKQKIPLNTVRTRLHRGRKMLIKMLINQNPAHL